MTEQDVNNTLHSFDVIKQYQASGQSFEDFFEENKDLVKNEYSHEFKFIYYSHSTHRVWITDDCFLEHKRTTKGLALMIDMSVVLLRTMTSISQDV